MFYFTNSVDTDKMLRFVLVCIVCSDYLDYLLGH